MRVVELLLVTASTTCTPLTIHALLKDLVQKHAVELENFTCDQFSAISADEANLRKLKASTIFM